MVNLSNWQAMSNSILIVDDNTTIRRSLHRLLEARSGWEVCGEAANGREGIEKAQRLKPDVVVMDMSMPEMDGIAKLLEDSRHERPDTVDCQRRGVGWVRRRHLFQCASALSA